MQRKTFLRLSLLLPYLVLGVSAAISIPLMNSFSMYDNWFISLLVTFTVSAIIWGPLYTWIAVVLWLWSIERSEEEIQRAYYLSPFMLAGAMGIPASIIEVDQTLNLLGWSLLHFLHLDMFASTLFPTFDLDTALVLAVAIFMMGSLCIIIGYVFVGPVAWLERALLKRNLLVTES